MDSPQPTPSFVRLEKAVSARDFQAAIDEIVLILHRMQKSRGSFQGFQMGSAFTEGGDLELYRHLATRYAAAFGDLVTSPGVKISALDVERLFINSRWTDTMFRLSGFQTSDHLIARLPHDANGRLTLKGSALINFLLVYSPSSNVGINLDNCYKVNRIATLIAAIGVLAARTCVTANAVALRDRILEWMPGKLGVIQLGDMQLSFAADSYMHCSYALTPRKHDIKAGFIAQFRKALLRKGAREMSDPPPRRDRPRVVVVCEHFHSRHSVFRTHSRATKALKDGFEVIGFGRGDQVDEPARECFHTFESYPDTAIVDCVKETADRILDYEPDMVFFLGVGMLPIVIGLASLRLAPVQCVSYGHTATTMSPVVDYMILPDDFIGADDIYSETLLRLPPESIPYAPQHETEAPPPPRVAREPCGVVRIAVPAAIMKINASFLQALAEAAERASRQVEFHFYPVAAIGIAYHHLEMEVTRILPQAVVFHQSDRQTYLERLGACEFFVSPFPYGNMNSIVDAILMGVPGVCLDGPEAHSHADLAIFRRLGLPEELCTKTQEEYVDAIVKLIDDADWRAECQKIAEEIDLGETMYKGDETIFCREMLKLLKVKAEA